MQSPKPVAFEIDIKKSPCKDLPIKTKLEKQLSDVAAPTLEQIELKLQKAEVNRKNMMENFLGNRDTDRVKKVVERKLTSDKENIEKMQKSIELKLESAEEKRQNKIEEIKDKARQQLERVERAT
jgi:hypothetical protein